MCCRRTSRRLIGCVCDACCGRPWCGLLSRLPLIVRIALSCLQGAAIALAGCDSAGLCVGGRRVGRGPLRRRDDDAVLLPPVVGRRAAPPLRIQNFSVKPAT